jgi:hypothetical protein
MTKITRRAALGALISIGSGAIAPAFAMDMADEIQAENAIRGSGRAAARVAEIDDVPSVGVVDLSFITSGFQMDRLFMDSNDFRILAERYAPSIQRLRRALRSNPATRAALDDHGINLSRVVGVQISSRGSLRLYTLR